MRVIITGGCGFLGQLLARQILLAERLASHGADGEDVELPVRELLLADVSRPPRLLFPQLEAPPVRVVLGSIADREFCESLFDGAGACSVFHLGAILSGQGEADFDLCLDVNLRGTMHMLEAARRSAAPRPRFVLSSAGATLGAGAPTDFLRRDDAVADHSRAAPHTTYGATKACAELLLQDYSRKGFVDGRGCRLPTVIVRAGAPNSATTSIFSGVVREPLSGQDTTSPLREDVSHAVTGHRTAVSALLLMHQLPVERIDEVLGFDRVVFIPSVAVTLGQLEEALRRVVTPESHERLGKVHYAPDEALSAAVESFPTNVDCSRAIKLGMTMTLDPEQLIRDYCEDFPQALAPGVALRPPAPLAPRAEAWTVALVTGAGSGIGRAVCIRLSESRRWVREGTSGALVLVGRRAAPLRETAAAAAAGVATLCVPADLTDEKQVGRLFAAIGRQFGRVDITFNNAGTNIPPTSFASLGLHDWKKVVDTNLTAAFLVARASFAMMCAQQPHGGRIINNGSVSADRPRPGSAPYTASKHAMTGLTKSISLDGRAHGVACGQIDFGNVESAMTAQMSVGVPQADGSLKVESKMSVHDAAEAVLYMASLPLNANVLNMTVMANDMPFVGRG
ncbi:hypothetical protein AB1Y20_022285 [Prymnesium parvum]|uniref:NAD-dependent epimerase/dehydratase domain-containing protein n=1 Tax=Prymnesium parvum TaxID=97485 RepID=A0AB34JFV9_PRYPA